MKIYTSGHIIRSIITIIALVIFACIIYFMGALKNTNSNPFAVVPPHFISTDPQPPVACTMDAKMCSDGSYVGRSGPNCEFVCPTK